jgi:hypothetical protein
MDRTGCLPPASLAIAAKWSSFKISLEIPAAERCRPKRREALRNIADNCCYRCCFRLLFPCYRRCYSGETHAFPKE